MLTSVYEPLTLNLFIIRTNLGKLEAKDRATLSSWRDNIADKQSAFCELRAVPVLAPTMIADSISLGQMIPDNIVHSHNQADISCMVYVATL